jgi:hypothetical protein
MKTTTRHLLTAAVAASLFGCAHQSEVQPLGTVELTAASDDVMERSPKAFYDGRDVYLNQHRWYFKEGDRWLYYRDEPPALRERRESIESADERHKHDPSDNKDPDEMFKGR